MEAVEPSLPALQLNLIHRHEIELYWPVIFGIAAGIWPTITAIIVTVSPY